MATALWDQDKIGIMNIKNNFLHHIWSIVLFILLIGLLIWGIWFVEDQSNKISVFGIIAVIMAAFTSVLTVSINHAKAKQREYELFLLKEKQKVYEHFYNSFFELLNRSRKGQQSISKKAIEETMLFKKGLMNWGSDDLIKKYLEYDDKLTNDQDNFQILKDGNIFLKEIRKDMGFQDSKELNIINVILNSEARRDLLYK